MDQQARHNNIKQTEISLDEAADQLEVSTASVRNWIKTGYLEQIRRGFVSRDSFDHFKDKVAGEDKLTARANKSLKDTHDHDELLAQYRMLISNDEICGDALGTRYEEALSNSYRNKEGVYYTPMEITEHFFRCLPDNREQLTFCDPCCGSGNFIMSAIEQGIAAENIHGYDIDPIATEVTRKRIFERTGYVSKNIHCINFLESSLTPGQSYFDIIFTNPPWGKKINKKLKQAYGKALNAGKSTDTSSLFFFACLNRLSVDGYLGFLLQDAFFNVATYEAARKKALSLQILSIIDFGKPFSGLLTKAKGIILKNTAPTPENAIECIDTSGAHTRLQSSFPNNPKCILNANTSQDEALTITHIYTLPHTTLAGQASWGLGIVTGNNKKFVIDKPADGYVAAYKGANIKKNFITDPDTFIPTDLSLYQQVAPPTLYQAKEKLIYKFISSRLVFFCDTQQRYILNSANLVIPDKKFPISQPQLSEILNSRVINWVFRSVFDTHKILRSDIESLPVHYGYFDKHSTFDDNMFARYLGLEEIHDGSFRVLNTLVNPSLSSLT